VAALRIAPSRVQDATGARGHCTEEFHHSFHFPIAAIARRALVHTCNCIVAAMPGMTRLQGKVALVTGAVGGIGEAIALRLAESGAAVLLTDIDVAGGTATAQRFADAGHRARYIAHDVSNEASWTAVMAEAVEWQGKVDVLVNNAGVASNFPKTFEEIALDEWQRVMRINLDGTFLGIKHGITAMKERGGGSIINIGSVAGYIGTPGGASYGTSKGAIRTLTKHAAAACARLKYGIRVNAIHPSNIWTPLVARFAQAQHGTVEAAKEAVAARHPYGRLGEPDDVAWLVVYLAADESRLMTGSDLLIDGGQLCN
jgi:NAD(P)-dependent dehydrogenase (short-subunit alcohol dehydrogenase family)